MPRKRQTVQKDTKIKENVDYIRNEELENPVKKMMGLNVCWWMMSMWYLHVHVRESESFMLFWKWWFSNQYPWGELLQLQRNSYNATRDTQEFEMKNLRFNFNFNLFF